MQKAYQLDVNHHDIAKGVEQREAKATYVTHNESTALNLFLFLLTSGGDMEIWMIYTCKRMLAGLASGTWDTPF